MKTSSKIIFGMLTAFILLIMSLGAGPVDQVKAAEAERPLAASNIWAKRIGSDGDDMGLSIALDSSGNIYSAGYFIGTVDFDPGPGTFNLSSTGYDIFILKLDDNGDFVWAKNIGGNTGDRDCNIALDSGGNVYTTGSFSGTVDFDPGTDVFNLTSLGSLDIFVLKLDGNGDFLWAKNMGGTTGLELGESSDIFVDSSGDVYTTGWFYGAIDFDPGTAVYNLSSTASNSFLDGDIFISKLDDSGNFVWARSMGGVGADNGYGITVDSTGNVYTTGGFIGVVDFDPGPGVFNLTSTLETYTDIFVSKLDGNGNFVWAKNMGWDGLSLGGVGGYGMGIALDPSGNVYTTGYFSPAFDFDPGPGVSILTSAGGYDIFASKLDSNGNFVWAKSIGGGWDDYGNDIAVDLSGNAYTAGFFMGYADFDPGAGKVVLPSRQTADAFVSKLDSNGNYVSAKTLGGTWGDVGTSIAVDSFGNAYTVGGFETISDFDPSQNLYELTSAGGYDIFISKLDDSPSSIPTFGDVHFNHPMYKYIQALYDGGFSAGCSTDPLLFCPDLILDRAQSAVFMLRGQLGTNYTPPDAPWNNFIADDWTGFEYAQPWAEGMYQEGLTQGCQSSPLMYCPATQLPRVEASVFGLRMKYGVNYTPPAASGTLFADFPSTDPSYWAIDWAEQAYNDGLLPACGTDSATGKPMFCPSQLVDRGWGAYLIVKAKNLPLP